MGIFKRWKISEFNAFYIRVILFMLLPFFFFIILIFRSEPSLIFATAKSLPAIMGISIILYFILYFLYQRQRKEQQFNSKIDALEDKVKTNPKETITAWELAKLTLQGYLNRNLNQVNSIFILSVFVITVGFCLIGYGVYKAFENPALIKPALLVSISGLIVNFIGASFLVIFKSTMNHAKHYVEVLERINAVGMSIQILDTIDPSLKELKENTRAEVAKELLKIYSPKN